MSHPVREKRLCCCHITVSEVENKSFVLLLDVFMTETTKSGNEEKHFTAERLQYSIFYISQ